MFIAKHKLQLVGSLCVLFLFATGIGCSGFFVDPTLTSIAVGPTSLSIVQGDTQQMSATGTYDDGSTADLTSSALWTSDTPSVASIGKTGLLTANAVGTASITAAKGTVSVSTTVTVTLKDITSIAVTPDGNSIKVGDQLQFKAVASPGSVDITDSATWSVTPTTTNITIDSNGLLTTAGASLTGPTTLTVTATESGKSGSATVTVSP